MVPPATGMPLDGELDTAFQLLGDRHRRHVLYLLREHESMPLDDLVDVLTGWLAVRDGAGVGTPADRDGVYAQLHHVHLPKLAAAGLVTLDEDAAVVALGSVPPPVDRLLETALELEPGTTAEAVRAATSTEG